MTGSDKRRDRSRERSQNRNQAERSRSRSSDSHRRSLSSTDARRRRTRDRSPSTPRYDIRDLLNCVRSTVESISRVALNQERAPIQVTHESRNTIPEFNPEETHQNVHSWIEKIEALKEMHGWSDTTTSIYMTARLRGLAKTWYESLTTLTLRWTEWKEKVSAAFVDQVEFPVRMQKMLDRKKSTRESIARYFFEKMALITPCGLKEKQAVQCIAHGIRDASIKVAIHVAAIENSEKLRIFLSKYDADYTDDRSASKNYYEDHQRLEKEQYEKH